MYQVFKQGELFSTVRLRPQIPNPTDEDIVGGELPDNWDPMQPFRLLDCVMREDNYNNLCHYCGPQPGRRAKGYRLTFHDGTRLDVCPNCLPHMKRHTGRKWQECHKWTPGVSRAAAFR